MAHIHDKIDYTVEVFIVHKNRVLLRMHDKYNKWLGVGGHVELNEDPNQAAIREAKEEVGMDIILDDRLKEFRQKDKTQELIPPFYLNKNRINKTHEHVTLIYFATTKSGKVNQDNSDEKSEECRWFSYKELLEDATISPNIKFYALKALEKLS